MQVLSLTLFLYFLVGFLLFYTYANNKITTNKKIFPNFVQQHQNNNLKKQKIILFSFFQREFFEANFQWKLKFFF